MSIILRDPKSQSYPGLWRIRCASSLAYHGLLGSVDSLNLFDMDLSLVPTKHLSSLVSCVTDLVNINEVRGLDLISVFQSIKSQQLLFKLFKQRLGTEETQAHVTRSKM